MAAKLPAKDVLCEAMDYLVKLGTNLRTRSENLKEKKIRKDNLTNTLAVQKLADKVLQICELSKKSLANVESGVRQILEQIDVSSRASSSIGGKSSSPKTEDKGKKSDDQPLYHYFDYKSHKLKIKNKISLKHYKSVSVLARKMSKSMISKFPVYHNCKLYRMRMREQSITLELENNKDPEKDKNNVTLPSEHQASSEKQLQNSSETDTAKNASNKNRRRSSEKTQRRNSRSDKTKSPHKKRVRNIIEDSEEDTEENKNKIINTNEDQKMGGNDCDGNSENENKSTTKNNDNKTSEIHDEHVTDKSFQEPKPKKRKTSKNDKELQNDNTDNVVFLDSDDENSNPCSTKNGKEESNNENSNPSSSKTGKEESDDENSNPSSSKNPKDDSEGNDDSENDSKKPVIKCVSLSKLLKPDILQKVSSVLVKKKALGNEFEFDVTKKNKMLQRAKKKKEELWTRKKKEVSEFKPKTFVINVIRLPSLNTEFLIKSNLKKITKEGDIVCEITKDKPDSIVQESKKSKKEHNNKSKQTIVAPAPALIDDTSDDEMLIAEANKVKNALLNESDSDNEIDTISNHNRKETSSDNTSNKEQEAVRAKENKISDITQERSSSDKQTQSDNDSNKDENSQAKQTKKKSKTDHTKPISDSEAAKHDLLEKSDSDDKSEKSDKVHKNEKNKNNSENDNDLPESPRNLKTPEKEQPASNNAKKSLLNDSSDDAMETPPKQKKVLTSQSKKKRIRESVQAKHALLRYSSGSETEDEKLRTTINDIKKSLLQNISDDENKLKAKNLDEQRRSSNQSSSSAEEILQKKSDADSSLPKKNQSKLNKNCINSDIEEGTNNNPDGDTKSTSSSRQMVRSKAKPGNSSSHSSDAQDLNDKDIDGLTNIRTLNKTRRRNSDAEQSESSSNSIIRTRMSDKPTGLMSKDMLQAESSSDAVSNEEDEAVDEDLPSVTVAGFNGGLEHQVKEDLLRESDSSVSNKEENKEDSDEEERLNAKRRKGNAIASSDSEAGNARKKVQDESTRLSDFEDSDDSEIAKRSKRKKKGSDSDGSAGSSDAGKKKRRRIKSVNDSDEDGSGSDSENEGKNKHGRKNIRKVMGKNQLEEATKKAAREEKERVARIAERQKMYNNLQFDESGKPDEVILDKVVLDFHPETKEPLIAVDRGLVKKLKPHQANGIKFMWDACFESAKRLKKDKGSGCILAHCMGLGKTLQVVALTHTLLAHDSLTKVHRVLVVCPLSTVLNWVNEFKMWLKYADGNSDIDVYELSRFKQNSERAFQLSQWFEHGGVCVLGYEMFRNLSADNNKKFKKKMMKNFQEALVEPGPDLVVCDEGHLLKNEKTSLSQSMNKVRTLRRIVLTGTPLQNNLKEYYCMVQFVKPNLLGKYNEYLNRFVNPITNGQYTDSTDHDIKIMKRRSHVLHKMLDGAVQRRDYGVLAPFLPPKHEYVLFITLTEVQTKLYQFYLDNYSRRPLPGKSSGFLFPDFQSLQRIWTHPLVLKYNSERYEIMQQKKRDKEEEDSEGSLVDFIDDDSTPDESSSADSTDDSSELSDDSRKKSKKKKSSKKSKGKDKDKDKESAAASRRRGTRANPIDLDLEDDKEDDILEVKNENPTEWWIKMVEEDVLEDMRNSHKLVLLFDILRQCETIGDKLLVFSQSLYSLDLIEHFLGKVDEATQEGRLDEKLGNHVGSWSPGIDYFRLDGSTSCENRSIWCKNFNREDNPRARLFLISTRAGGLGINLVAANRVVIFDVSWNPSHDVQSIFRVYRFGQKKPCYVYRFLAMGTMEEKIYERQVTKQAISKRVIDEQQIDRHYAENDLAELYKFEAEPPTPRPIPPLPKDRLFAEMLREHEAQIYKYHEHDSLLENKEEETLSEEERKAAWEDFENEKNRPPPAPFPSPWPMHNGMVPNLLAQQQQQLAYAALAAMLRKDMPNVNDNQIRDMLPMIYNANPALMQKMSELYKYSQQMNMTPGMMAQGMNPAGPMAGMGGASGLQYEPPWQRQQQQQQQMRLQQLMAQQQSMGAASKYYAGGLGSRDPAAMALQQQRAREIMAGGGAGRPRGRPPLQPRGRPPLHAGGPPTPSADVVNLDSD